VLAKRAAAGPLQVTLFDGVMSPGWSWPQRDAVMARRLLAGSLRDPHAGGGGQCPHPGWSHGPGVPLGAWLARQRPGIREIRICYGGGRFWNPGHADFARRASPYGPVWLYQDAGELVLDLPVATEAVVPQRP
jgi:hypothetical protein